ncbi:RsmE family RNA methyltransferase, partial [Phocaeicola vulgatus]
KIQARILDIHGAESELKTRIVLFQGLPKGDKMDLVIQKAIELGASEIVPVKMKRCVVKLDEKKARKKTERWNAVA